MHCKERERERESALTGTGFLLGEFIDKHTDANSMDGLSSHKEVVMVADDKSQEHQNGDPRDHCQKCFHLGRLFLHPPNGALYRVTNSSLSHPLGRHQEKKKKPCSADDDCEENATRPDQTTHKKFPNSYKKTFMKTGCLSPRLSRPVKSIRNLSPVNVNSKANKGKERHQKISAKLKEMLDCRTLSLARSIRRDTRP